MKREIYLDNSATTKPHDSVVHAMVAMMADTYGNPSSLHRKGLLAEKELDKAREKVAKALGVKKAELLFTSGGTEANNLALFGVARQYASRGKHIITTQIEHACVYDAAEALQAAGYDITFLKPDAQGLIRVEDVQAAWREDTILVSVMHVNNETGAIQPIEAIGRFLQDKRKTLFHVDAVQGLGKLPLRPKDWGVDLLAISAHKIHGPKGVGALYVRDGVTLMPLFYGGGQEKGIRSGTENAPGIVGFGVAVELATKQLSQQAAAMTRLRDRLIEQIAVNHPDARLNTPQEQAAPHVINVSFPGLRGEVLVHALETNGLFISTGSACSSREKIVSRPLAVMGLSERELEGAVRLSLSPETREADIDEAAEILKQTVSDLQMLYRR